MRTALLLLACTLIACARQTAANTPIGAAACTPAPTVPYVCGDGVQDPGERCDDGNLVAGDGCSAVCLSEAPADDIFSTASPEHALLTKVTSELPNKDGDNGSFRLGLVADHFSYDDPLVHPCAQATAHLHEFFGNWATDYQTTHVEQLYAAAGSSIQGGVLNKTAYWFPALLRPDPANPGGYVIVLLATDGRTEVYYKQGLYNANFSNVQPYPAGLRMIAGNHMASASNLQSASVIKWSCGSWIIKTDADFSPVIPRGAKACKPGDYLHLTILFPNCWNGRDLDSADHKAHMFASTGSCPAAFPVAVPRVSYELGWPVPAGTDTSDWFLSSDQGGPATATMPGGYSAHGDWFMAWDPRVMRAWVAKCINEHRHCANGDLGNGWAMRQQGPGHVQPIAIPNHGLTATLPVPDAGSDGAMPMPDAGVIPPVDSAVPAPDAALPPPTVTKAPAVTCTSTECVLQCQ